MASTSCPKGLKISHSYISRNPELDVPRTILEGSIAVASTHNKVEAWLSPHEIDHLNDWLKHIGADPDKLNVNGGAIALGHPLGASGTKLMATLVHALKARGKKYGLQTMCEGGGVANVTIVEAL